MYDRARLQIFNQINQTVYLWTQNTACYQCPLVYKTAFNKAKRNATFLVNTNYGLHVSFNKANDSASSICTATYNLADQGLYQLNLTWEKDACQQLQTLVEGRNNIWPLVIAFFLFILFAAVFYGGRWYRNKMNENRAMEISSPTDPKTSEANKRKRLKSLDCFRGITILMMIFANYGSGGYEFLEHAPWDGIHWADFIFPWFIFIMGSTMAISFKSLIIRQKLPKSQVFWKITERSLKLFVIGFMLGSKRESLSTVRIPGVLQRFGASYFVVATAHATSLYLYEGQLIGPFRFHQLIDLIPFYIEWIVMAFFALIYFVLTFAWKFDPSCPVGYVGPGGLYQNASFPYCTGGAARKIDEWILSKNHMYKHFTAREIYDPQNNYKLAHDPEGILGTTNSILLTFVGLQIGKILVSYPEPPQRFIRWTIWSLILTALTVILAVPGYVPINKNLWSFTFITITGAAAILMLCILYYLIDVAKIWPKGQPFHYPGMNAILLYIGHSITSGMFPFALRFGESNSHVQPLISNLTGTILWLVISIVLAKKRIFLTI